MTNETYLAMTSDRIRWAKKNMGKNPTPSLIGVVAQMYACATHDIDAQKMATIKARNVPTLVVGALHDKMIKYERSKQLAKELTQQMGRPIRYSEGELHGFEHRAKTMMDMAPQCLANIVPPSQEHFTRF